MIGAGLVRRLAERRGGPALTHQPVAAPPAARLGVVVNPVHPAGMVACAQLTDAARARGVAVDVRHTTIEQTGAAQAGQAVAAGCDVVVAIGGDGTVREVARALAGADADLAILPTGTANLFARNLGLTGLSREQAIEVALIGRRAASDLGRVSLARSDTDALGDGGARAAQAPVLPVDVTAPNPVADRAGVGTSGDEVFLVVAGIGNDALTVELVRPTLKRRIGWLAYFGPALRTISRAPEPMALELDGVGHQVRAWSVLLANTGRLPAGTSFAPGATLDSGVLDVVEVRETSPRGWFGIAATGLLGRRRDSVGIRQRQAAQVTVRPAVPQPVQLDGDVVSGISRVTAWVDADALRVRVP